MVNLDCLTRITVTPFVLVILCVCWISAGTCSSLKIVGVAVPPLADLREPANLACSYDTGQDALFSVKWYKDDHEFYRYMPMHKPSVLTFPFEGAELGDKSCGKSQCSVRLEHLSPSASGAYTCEVSIEAPTFRTAIETRNMTVAAFPLEEPRIEGLRSAYTIGDVLDITCKSAPSAPAAQLTMFVNNKEASLTSEV
ncbi:uncharacterized protein LOC143914103 [Arctopsyche grandis]|uniref:uncharacterized protein LOC143914103 n=1 Tax=Arctopsyche grandis TaxID=121162 RepID=UPI00406D89BF